MTMIQHHLPNWTYWLMAVIVAVVGLTSIGDAYFRWFEGFAPNLFRLDAAMNIMTESSPRGDMVMPVTLVDIDDATVIKWGCPLATPLDKLTGLLEVITKAKPAAVVIDIDLSDPADSGCRLGRSGEAEFASFLRGYGADTPLVFVRRIIEARDGRLMIQHDHFDKLFEGNRMLSWAHAVYPYDSDGTTRRWIESIEACWPTATETVPSAPVRVLAVARWRDKSPFMRPAASMDRNGTCYRQALRSNTHLIIFNQAAGASSGVAQADLMRVPAWQFLAKDIQRDDGRLLSDRVVVIGNSHSYAGDVWRVPVGNMAGAELIAHTIRFAAGQLAGSAVEIKKWAIGLFVVFCSAWFFLRPFWAAISAFLITWTLMWTAVGFYGFFSIVDSVESALLLFLAFLGIEELISLVCGAFHNPQHLSKYIFLSKRFHNH